MFVEASRMDGEGQLTLTGQLGDVMKESAHLAISWLRSNAKRYQLTNGAPAGTLWGSCGDTAETLQGHCGTRWGHCGAAAALQLLLLPC